MTQEGSKPSYAYATTCLMVLLLVRKFSVSGEGLALAVGRSEFGHLPPVVAHAEGEPVRAGLDNFTFAMLPPLAGNGPVPGC